MLELPGDYVDDRARLLQACLWFRYRGLPSSRRMQRRVVVYCASICGVDPDYKRTFHRCWPTNRAIAERTGMTQSQVVSAIAELVVGGFLTVEVGEVGRELVLGSVLTDYCPLGLGEWR